MTERYGDTRDITNELIFKISEENIGEKLDNKLRILIHTKKQYRPTDFIYQLLTQDVKGIKALEAAMQTTISGQRKDVLSEEAREKTEDLIVETLIPNDFVEAIGLFPDDYEERGDSIILDATSLEEINEMLEEYDSAPQELKERYPDFDFDKAKGEYVKRYFQEKTEAFVGERVTDINDPLNALIAIAEEENKNIADLAFSQKYIGEGRFESDNNGVLLLNMLTLLEKYDSGDTLKKVEEIYTPASKGKEAKVNSEAKKPFLDELNTAINELSTKFREGIKNKLQSIIDNPGKYPKLYGMKKDQRKILDLQEILPKQFFSIDVGQEVNLIRWYDESKLSHSFSNL